MSGADASGSRPNRRARLKRGDAVRDRVSKSDAAQARRILV